MGNFTIGGIADPQAAVGNGAGMPRSYLIIALEGIDGAGKTAVSTAVETELNTSFNALRTRLSVQMGNVFREMVDVPSGGAERYQDVIPGNFRFFTYIVDAAVQFRYLADIYNRYDILIFDRWLPTYYIYCADPGRGSTGDSGVSTGQDQPAATWRHKLISAIPKPDLIFYLKVDPRAAALRLTQRGDWTARRWSDAELLADLTRLDARYCEAMGTWPGHIVDGNAPLPQVIDAVLDRVADLLDSRVAGAGA